MERFTRDDENDVVSSDEPADEAEPWVMGRDLSQPDADGASTPSEQPSRSGARIVLAGVAAGASAVAMVFVAVMLFGEQQAPRSWPLALSVLALLVAAAALFAWWRQGADDPAVRRTFPR